MLFWWKNAQNLGLYFILVCDGNAAYVYCGRGNYWYFADHWRLIVVIFIVFMPVAEDETEL